MGGVHKVKIEQCKAVCSW